VSTRDQLLQEIWTDPLADQPRLVFADLLEKEGDLDRANFIRLQVGREAMPAWDPRVVELELEERALLAEHGAAWRAALPKHKGVEWGSFSRGFVGKVAFDAIERLQQHRKACLAAAPVHSIAIRWARSGALPKLQPIDGLRELTMVGAVMRPEDLKWLATCPLLVGVRSLNLIDSELRAGLPHLLKSPHLAALEALRMPLHTVGNAGIKKLTESTFAKLTALDLSVGTDEQLGSGRRVPTAKTDARSVLELASWRQLAQIEAFDYSGSKLGREGLSTLLMSPYTKGLKQLAIRDIADADWEMDDSLAAFEAGPAGALEELDIRENDIDSEAALALAECKALQDLKVLDMVDVHSKSFERLAQARWIHSLRVLSCGPGALPPILARAPKQLHTITLVRADAAATEAVVKALAAAPQPALRSLDLGDSKMQDDTVRALGRLETLPNLVSVSLRGNVTVISHDAAAEFARSPLGSQLKSLDTGFEDVDRLAPSKVVPVGRGLYRGPFRYL